MKRLLITVAFVAAFLISHAQQPPPKNPKDPDAIAKDPDSSALIDPPVKIVKLDPQQIFTAVEHEPTYPGGMMKFYDYIKENLKYPDKARENGVEGRVVLGFVVEKDGSLSDIKVYRGISSECDAEAIRLLKASQKWEPGTQNGHIVRVMYNVIISFKL